MALWTPANLGSELKAWFRADAITGLNDGDAVATWSDSSGNGFSATQGTAGLRPVFKTNILNGLPAVRFTRSSAHRLSTSLSASQQPESIAAVVIPASDHTGHILGSNGNGGRGLRRRDTNDDAQYVKFFTVDIADSTDTIPVGSATILAATLGASTYLFSINGGTANTGSHGQTLTAGRTSHIGCSTGSGTEAWDGDIPEIIVTHTDLSTANRQLLDGYLAWKYAIAANLATGHPYKDRPPGSTRSGLRYPLGSGLRNRTLR